MTRVIGLTITVLLLLGVSADARQPGRQKKHARTQPAAVETHRDQGATATVHVVFGARDIQQVRRHYGSRFSNLPPGLRKKVARGGSLPPGWKKKIEPFPVALERGLSRLPVGYSRGVIDAHAVIYNSKGMIIDVAVLF